MAGLYLSHLKYQVIEPALMTIGLMSTTALALVTGTALVESKATYLKQMDTGPALGLWQVEPATEQDIWANYLAYQHDLAAKVRSLLAPGATTMQLVGNLPYGAAICRIKYRRSPLALPESKDALGMATMWKTVYNTAGGAGTADPAHVALFQTAIDA
jgi:hypothetical protein